MYQSERDPYDEYDVYADDDGSQDTRANAFYARGDDDSWGYLRRAQSLPLVEQALDWGFSGSVLAILVLTAFYVFVPADSIPDLVPFAGQADDLAAVLAGGGAVGFLTVIRFFLRTRVSRWGCLVAIVLSAIGAFTVYWILMSLFEAAL